MIQDTLQEKFQGGIHKLTYTHTYIHVHTHTLTHTHSYSSTLIQLWAEDCGRLWYADNYNLPFWWV